MGTESRFVPWNLDLLVLVEQAAPAVALAAEFESPPPLYGRVDDVQPLRLEAGSERSPDSHARA